MRFIVEINGKKYKLKFFEWLAYQNQRQLNRIDKKLDAVLKGRETEK